MGQWIGMLGLIWVVASGLARFTSPTLTGIDDGSSDAPKHESREDSTHASSPPTNLFYHGRRFGSESVFSPASVFLNRGFDSFQFADASRNLFSFPYAKASRNVYESLAHPGEQIEKVGLGRFVTTEVLPLNFRIEDARWFPNYVSHLIGGGISYVGLNEWFSSRGFVLPRVWAAATIIGAAFLNEAVENRGFAGRVPDHVADFYFFDIPGILLFNIDGVSRFFSHKLNAADWSPMPSITWDGSLRNAGQYMVYRIRPVARSRFMFFMRFGMGGMVGLSYTFRDQDSITLALGRVTDKLAVADERRAEFSITTQNSLGIFVDRGNSLLASLILSQNTREPVALNIYPGVVPVIGRFLGFWILIDRDGRPMVGVASRYTLGIGFGVGN
jgi:hypothetical protein